MIAEPAKPHGPFGCVVLAPPTSRPQSPTRPTRDDQFHERLADWLLFMVPMFIAEQRNASDQEMERARTDALEQIASHGDDLQFGGKHQGSSRTALAKGFAILARAEGGVTALGVHACTVPHAYCPAQPHPGPSDAADAHTPETAP
ncbi:hypothetical protein [Streptomyces sp. RKAG337]|uniref:hypothetical protein n=1 Tax=Streptomyces sp. RKAG337 TaxID=2893404 RepID=UPI0020334064|nr:hypothetical protein [Streptomyces sp. RKAG337]MCM2430909.1 hypothetical protein [Streptomyces sp. RKAG337]